MPKVDPNQMVVKLRVMLAEIRQPYQKDIRELEAAEKYLLAAIQRGSKDDLLVCAKKVAHSKARIASFERVLQAIDHIRENAKFICQQAAADKSKVKMCPQEYEASFQCICAVAEALRTASFSKFRSDTLVSLYSKQAVAALSDRSKLEEVVRAGLFEDPIDNAGMARVFADFCQKYLDDPTPLEQLIGYSLAPFLNPGAPAGPAPIAPNQQVAYGGPKTYQPNPTLFVPVALADFPKETWGVLSEQVYAATA